VEDYDDFSNYGDEEERPRDPAVDQAIERLRGFFDASSQRLSYSTQIETSFEREFFHWITGKALLELGNSQQIKRLSVPVQGQTINFYANRKHRYVQRELKTMLDVLRRIFDPDFTHAIGRHGELMFDAALGRNGFRLKRATQTAGTARHGNTPTIISIVLSQKMGLPMGLRLRIPRTTFRATSCA
jgi:hypothetical protein